MTLRRLVLLLPILLLPGCSARDSAVAEDGRERLVGLRADDLRLCAGVPNLTANSAGGEFWTYDRSPPASGVSAPVPVTVMASALGMPSRWATSGVAGRR